MTYVCTLSPLFDIQLVNNDSHIVTLTFQPYQSNTNISVKNETELFPDEDEVNDVDVDAVDDIFGVPIVVNELALTLISESRQFHRGVFLLKCLFTPFVIGALLLFCVRMYLNDLYISIPDRLLIAVALAQVSISSTFFEKLLPK